MRYTFLTHTKENNKHYLNLDIDMSTHDFFVESSFIATDAYLGNEQIYFNGTLYTATMVPDIELLFSANDCVYCVIDMKHKKIIITDIHKAACDSLIVFNNFSNNPTTQFPSQNNILFSKSITIANDTDKYQDIIMGGCIILENAMAEDGVGSFAMYLDVYFNGKHTYRYALDCTRKHECLCFDHLFKNVRTNEPIDIYVQYSYGTHKYGYSYVSPTIYNNNVTFYIEGANITYGDSSNIFTYSITDETHSGTSGYGSTGSYATVTGVINRSLTAYRIPDYCTVDGVRYPVKQVYWSNDNYLPNCKYMAFGNNVEVIYVCYIYTDDMTRFSLYNTDYVSAEQGGYFKNRGVIVIYPDSGLRYIYGSDNYNNYGGFYNDQKSYVIKGNPDRLFYLYYDIGGSSLPRGEYPSLTFDDIGIFYCYQYSMSFRKTNNLTINAKLIGQLYYSNTYSSYRNTSYPGISCFTQSEGGLSIQEPSNTININLNCEACNSYYLMNYYHFGRAVWDKDDGVEYDDYKGYSTSVLNPNVVRFYEQKMIFNINGIVFYGYVSGDYGNTRLRPEVAINILSVSENSTTGEITCSGSTDSLTNYGYTINSYNSWSMTYNYTSQFGFNAAVRPWFILNIHGDCYSSLYTSTYYCQNKITIDGDLCAVPMGSYAYLYNNPFPQYYIQNDYYYRDGYYFPNDWEIKGTYDISKQLIKTVVRRIKERRGWYFDEQGNKLPSYKYYTKVWEPNYEITPSTSLASLTSYSISYTTYFRRFKVHKLAGLVYIPTKSTSYSSYSMFPKAKEGDIQSLPQPKSFFYNTWTNFSYDEIEDDTIILSFGEQDLTNHPIDFSKLSCIGNLYSCNLLRIELENPIVAFLVPPDPGYFYRPNFTPSTPAENYIYETEDEHWDPNWHTYSDQYDAYIDFNAVCLGNISLQFESTKIPDEEVAENMFIKYKKNCSSMTDEDIAEIDEYLETLTEEERATNSLAYRKAECDYYKVKLPKKSNIALDVEDFEFDRTSSFNYASYYTTINNEFVVYPQIKLYDCTKYVGSGFLYNHPYYPEGDGDIITLPANLKFFGNRSFRYTMYKKEIVGTSTYFRQVQLNDNYSYYGYKAGETSTSTFDFIEDSVFEGYPISEVRIGKYLEELPEVFPYADRMTIDPENPNFVISNGYIFSPDMKTLYRPVCYTELASIEPTAQNKYVFQSSVLETIVDFRSFRNDRRITGIEITSDSLVIKPNSAATLYLPENCDRIILPSGNYTILDSDFDKLSYIEFLNITPTSKYYTIPGSEAGDVYSNFNKTYYYTMNNPQTYSSSSWQSFSVTGSRMIFIRTGANVTLPNTCIDIGGKIQAGIMTIQQDKITELNVSSPNVRIEGYDIAGANSIFFKDGTDVYYTVDGQVKSDFLWSRMNKNTGSSSSTTVFLYKIPTGPEIDTLTINLDYDKFISPAALKYCNISNIVISARPNPSYGYRNMNIFSIPITTESYKSSVPYGFFNDYDKTLHYDDEDVAYLKQYAITSNDGKNYNYTFNQTHYNDVQYMFNKLCMPVLNNHLDSLTIDFDPELIVSRLRWNGIYISTGITLKEANNNYSTTFARMYYSGNEWIVNQWILPEIDDFYINYDYTSKNEITIPFPVDEKFKNIHFNTSGIAGITKIGSLVVCAAGVKIFPADILDQITNHSYKLYYCPDTNLSLSATSYTSNTFGEQSGCPFPSNTTLTFTSCFIHPLFVHPDLCSNIDLVLSADTKFGYSTQIVTDATLVGTNKNMLNQYSDYIRSWSSSSYFNGTTSQLGKYFYLFSPALGRAAYMAKQLAVFSHITSPRLFTYLFRADNISSSDDTYKIYNGSWFELNCVTLVSIPYYCFDVETTDAVSGSGYNLFSYQQFHDMLLDLTSIDQGNRIQIPTNPNGDTDYVFNSGFIDWKIPFVSRQQKRIDSWTITNSTINGFVERNALLHFIDNIIYSGVSAVYMAFGKMTGYGSSSTYYSGYVNDSYGSYTYLTYDEDITVTIDPGALTGPITLDIGGAIMRDVCNADKTHIYTASSTNKFHNNFIMDFAPNIDYVIRQIGFPNCDSEELDFTQYPTCNFVFGDTENFDSATDYRRCLAVISGFKRVVFGSNVSIYQGNGSNIPALPNILFFSSKVQEIEYQGSEVYGIMSSGTGSSVKTTITTTFSNSITTFNTIFEGSSSCYIEVDLNRVENIIGWTQETAYTDQSSKGYAFNYCDFTNSTFDHLITIANRGGIKNSKFSSQVTMPNLTTVGEEGMYGNSGIEELSLPLCTSAGNSSFYANGSLTTLSAPSLVTIGNYAFYHCPITGVLTLDSAETIGQHAFDSLYITEVYLPAATDIADNAFYDCRNITKAYIPAGCNISITSFFNNTEIVRT